MGEYSYLDPIIENIIDKNLKYKKEQLEDCSEKQILYIKLKAIEKYNFNDEEIKYIFNYLNSESIYVIGKSKIYEKEIQNYIYDEQPTSLIKNHLDLIEEEQNELLELYKKTKDINYRNELLLSYIRLVENISRKYSFYTGIDYNELTSYGYEAIIKAIDRYDSEKSKLFTFLSLSISQAIIAGIMDYYDIHSKELYAEMIKTRKITRSKHEFDRENYDETLYLEEIVDEFSKLREETNKNSSSYYLNKYKDRQMLYLCYCESIDKYEESIEASEDKNLYLQTIEPLYQKQVNEHILKQLNKLTKNQSNVIINRFGLAGKESITMREMADKTNVSCQNIAKLEKKGLVKLEKYKRILEEDYAFYNHEYDKENQEINYTKVKKER